jgi:hypothetical protein
MTKNSQEGGKRSTPPLKRYRGVCPLPDLFFLTAQNLQQLVDRAIQEFDDYQKLMSQGKFAEAGQKLEQHKRTLEEIRRLSK